MPKICGIIIVFVIACNADLELENKIQDLCILNHAILTAASFVVKILNIAYELVELRRTAVAETVP